MKKRETENKNEAIRTVLNAGVGGDYCDVVEEVRRRFGLTLGIGQVEQIHLAMTQQKSKPTGTNPDGSTPDPTARTYRNAKTLEFVNQMGGFEEAQTAISELQKTLKKYTR